MSNWYIDIARSILIPMGQGHLLETGGLLDFLDDINYYTEQAGGKLVSRQVVALAIVTWKNLNKVT